jgi:hypothetical protein
MQLFLSEGDFEFSANSALLKRLAITVTAVEK